MRRHSLADAGNKERCDDDDQRPAKWGVNVGGAYPGKPARRKERRGLSLAFISGKRVEKSITKVAVQHEGRAPAPARGEPRR